MGSQAAARRVDALPEGIEIREGARGSRLRVVFNYQGERCRETLKIPATPANIKYAERLRAEVLNAIERGTFDYAQTFPNSRRAKAAAAVIKRHLVCALIDTYIDTLRAAKALSPSSIATYVKWARSRLKPEFQGKHVDELTTPGMRTWVVKLTLELAPKSVRNCVGLLSSVLNQAATDGLIPSNPLAPIKLKTLIPKKRREDDKVDPFNSEEVPAIIGAFQVTEEKALFQFAFSTGLRTGELIGIKWAHIDWKSNTIHVQDNVVTGENVTVEKETKTGTERDVPLLPAALAALQMMKPLTMLADSYIFTCQGNRWRNDQQIRARWKAGLKRAGVRYRNPYQTRHTFASTLLMNGEPEIVVARLLGHTTVEMVRRHYGRFINEPKGITMRGDYSKQFSAAPNAPQISKTGTESQS